MSGQLLRFRVANHRSLRDEQELSFIASDRDRTDLRLIRSPALEEPVLPVCAIYGANASGKSNVLDALWFTGWAVVSSHRTWEPEEGIPRSPFALRADHSEASSYILDFTLDDIRYEYGFSVDEFTVHEEWLRAWPNGRKQEWFSRDGQQFEFHRTLHGENKTIEALTRNNSLFLSAAAQNNHDQLTPIFRWLRESLRIVRARTGVWVEAHPWWLQFTRESSEVSLLARDQVRTLLQYADLGIDDFQVNTEKFSQGEEKERRAFTRTRIQLAHRGATVPTWMDLHSESTGTQTLVGLLPELIMTLHSGGLLAIDELGSLHPMLAMALVQLFQDPKQNPHGAQLLFNTHDSSLLGNLVSDPPPLRRDQIWFTEKDQEGATKLYPLTDFTPRKEENLQRGYLQGRYGAVPFIGSLDWEAEGKEGQ